MSRKSDCLNCYSYDYGCDSDPQTCESFIPYKGFDQPIEQDNKPTPEPIQEPTPKMPRGDFTVYSDLLKQDVRFVERLSMVITKDGMKYSMEDMKYLQSQKENVSPEIYMLLVACNGRLDSIEDIIDKPFEAPPSKEPPPVKTNDLFRESEKKPDFFEDMF